MKAKDKGPQFIRFFKPVIEALKELDGSGTAAEVIDRAIVNMNISEKEQQATTKNGQSRVRNQVNWARLYLVHAGYLDSSKRGVWSLTDKGISIDISSFDPYAAFKSVQDHFKDEKKAQNQPDSSAAESEEIPDDEQNHRAKLLDLIKGLPPSGFERLSQRLLRESGFQQVVVTGKSGDGGIDGIGILQVNPFVSFNVLFQCKRYQGAVTPSQVRDFRGAMQGRADKGIVITTGTFTVEATKEARRDGVPPIELVDGQLLVEMFERLELGLIPRRTFDIDEKFFEDFRI
ncbi:restriction endonuclease [Chlorobium phaeobacteroides]|uniref:Restriction endonuclease n=1 Tax=Chlorobium phaeobacteroides (strain DSM 266 / SMG 266 / 2430) TaxID=290317 RepID=A1BGV9_CHLPD|nr:restriction endonuclease [Chlorobium phaeobacteroides]ABL65636.1 restriction endonuclease [Chlorobium phaeobacteroides DSM 266]